MYNLRKIRKRKRLSQKDVANYLGIAQTGISDLERGKRRLSVEIAEKLCLFYECSYQELICQKIKK